MFVVFSLLLLEYSYIWSSVLRWPFCHLFSLRYTAFICIRIECTAYTFRLIPHWVNRITMFHQAAGFVFFTWTHDKSWKSPENNKNLNGIRSNWIMTAKIVRIVVDMGEMAPYSSGHVNRLACQQAFGVRSIVCVCGSGVGGRNYTAIHSWTRLMFCSPGQIKRDPIHFRVLFFLLSVFTVKSNWPYDIWFLLVRSTYSNESVRGR